MTEEPNLDTHPDPNDTGEGDRDSDGDGGKRTVPLEALEAERRNRQASEARLTEVSERLARLEGAVSASSGNGRGKEYSRAELKRAVDDGQISEDEMEDVLDRQRERRLMERLTKQQEQTTRAARIKEELERYVQLEPALSDSGSDIHRRVAEEFRYKRDVLGRPDDVSTELDAARTVLGPVEALRQAKSGTRSREHHQETGGSSGRETKKETGPKWPDGTSQRFKDYYEGQIAAGRTTKEEAIKRLKAASPRVKSMAGVA